MVATTTTTSIVVYNKEYVWNSIWTRKIQVEIKIKQSFAAHWFQWIWNDSYDIVERKKLMETALFSLMCWLIADDTQKW